MDKNSPNKVRALEALVRRDFKSWSGLPDCSLGEIEAVMTVDQDWRGANNLGSDRRPAEYVTATVAGYSAPLNIWLEGQQVLMIEMDLLTERPRISDLVPDLGSPEVKLDNYLGIVPLPGSEWVYASRGLTLFTDLEGGSLLRLVVYPPTTSENYRRRLRLDYCVRLSPLGNLD